MHAALEPLAVVTVTVMRPGGNIGRQHVELARRYEVNVRRLPAHSHAHAVERRGQRSVDNRMAPIVRLGRQTRPLYRDPRIGHHSRLKLAPLTTDVMTGGEGMDAAIKRTETSGRAQLPGTQPGGP